MGVIFAWWTSRSGGEPNYSMINVTLDCPWAFKVTSVMDGSFAKELLLFIQEIDAREGEWKDARILKTPDEDFVISCFECWKREISVEVSLDSAWDDPEWTVQVRFDVDVERWHDFAIQFEEFFSEGSRHRA
jgi:hypothetical protein